jgi:hypothetical protein
LVKPRLSRHSLSAGLYAAAGGSAWAELHPGAIEFMGARETLVANEPRSHSIPSTLEMDITVTPQGIEGTIGGLARHLTREAAGLTLHSQLIGTWREETFGTVLVLSAEGIMRWPWMGIRQDVPLTPLPGRRALADLRHLVWRNRLCLCLCLCPCLWLDGEDTLHVTSHRARVMRFRQS